MLFFAAGAGAVFTLLLMICIGACTLQNMRIRRTFPCHTLLTEALSCLSEALGGLLDVVAGLGAAGYSIQEDVV